MSDFSFYGMPKHAFFRTCMRTVTVVDVTLQIYAIYLILRVAASTLKHYRYFMLLCSVRLYRSGTKAAGRVKGDPLVKKNFENSV